MTLNLREYEADCHTQVIDLKSVASTARRALDDVKYRSHDVEPDQRVEGYIRALNERGQFGVVVYSNNELVVPGISEDFSFMFNPSDISFMDHIVTDGESNYWDSLETKVPDGTKKEILMTFQAHAYAVIAFEHCIPVICVDATFVRYRGEKYVLLAATYSTTENSLVTMCYGTAEKETESSWKFFLINLRQTIKTFCPSIEWKKLVFMNDRHIGILKGVKQYFPECHHLYCTYHILGNLNLKHPKIDYYWKAVDAKSEDVFNQYCKMIIGKEKKRRGKKGEKKGKKKR